LLCYNIFMANKQHELNGIAQPLLTWYRQNARSLPWRDNPTPYGVLLSEIMLQQTRVEAVREYYLRFLRELPDFASLAAVPEERLLKLWEGLGYYNRARNLQKTAQIVTKQLNGVLPASPDKLMELPGIGPYTAAAVSSIAFGIPAPAVDGNVLRVLARLRADHADIADPKTRKDAETLLRNLIPADAAGDFTQAMMELGAIVCLPNGAPLCNACPLVQMCRAYALQQQADFPVKSAKKKRRKEKRTVLLITCGGKVALQKRAKSGLLAGMWEYPSLGGNATEQDVCTALDNLGVTIREIRPLPQRFKHIFTHVEWHMAGFSIKTAQQAGPFLWVSQYELQDSYALPSAFRNFTNLLDFTD